jgi:hypothetical protein
MNPLPFGVSAWIGALLLTWSLVANADCEGQAQRNAQFLQLQSNSDAHFTVAGELADAGCLKKATAELDQADELLEKESGSNDAKATRRASQDALREFIHALAIRTQAPRESDQRLLDILDHRFSSSVLTRTVTRLLETIPREGSDEDWRRFEAHLRDMEVAGPTWQPVFARRIREATHGDPDGAMTRLNADLSKSNDTQRQLALRVLLVELLVIEEKTPSARMQCTHDGQRMGDTLLDPKLRLRFLTSCENAWQESSRYPATPQSIAALAMLTKATAQLRSEL